MSAATPASTMPVLFVGHGSPMNALEDNAFTRGWQDVAQRIAKPRAILCVSAHWESRGVYVSSALTPETIHDFYGFPQALFDVRYPAPGDPALAQRVTQLIKRAQVHTTTDYGLDHGAWSVLRIMYPQADIPVLQLSLDTTQPGAFHYRLGQELGALRDEGVLILASGNIVHNLRLFRFNDAAPTDWAARADASIRSRIESSDHAVLADWRGLGADVALGIPTPEHYLPLLYALGAQRKGDNIHIFNNAVTSAISMTSVLIG
jgi:4,5-DOPA dioxygenase extradiol